MRPQRTSKSEIPPPPLAPFEPFAPPPPLPLAFYYALVANVLAIQLTPFFHFLLRSFYSLSKAHHPDHNQADPNASRRFMRISEAYSTLSNTTKRAKYDRDVLRLHERSAAHHHQGGGGHHNIRTGSYSSTGPAGGRPASGLSRRRGTFRGPPPSFYRSGGWGAHAAKRSAAHEGSTAAGSGGGGDASSSSSSSSTGSERQQQHENPYQSNSGGYTSYNAGGMGPGQEPFGRGWASSAEMPHFDRTAQAQHTQTHARHDARRAQRMAHEFDPFPASSGDLGHSGKFLAILGVLGFGLAGPYLFIKAFETLTKKKKAKE